MKTAEKLRKFRQTCERETGTQAQHIELPLLHVLNDVCQVLKLPQRDRRRVLGQKGVTTLDHVREFQATVKPPTKRKQKGR